MSRPRLLDLFCGAGGCSVGYHHAGFDVVGVDVNPQKNYPFEFHQADAMAYPLGGFDVIHASPPCQAFTKARKLQGNTHPDLIGPIRERLIAAGVPWVIENVPGAPLSKSAHPVRRDVRTQRLPPPLVRVVGAAAADASPAARPTTGQDGAPSEGR